jgi:ATP synthase protein I
MATARSTRNERWDDEEDETQAAAVKPLTREEAAALRARKPPLSPWRVIGVQVAVGAGVALIVALLTGRGERVLSALYGTAAVVLPGVLMARGMTSRLSRLTPVTSAVSVMSWSMVKIGASVAMLMLAPKLVQPLSWPVLLAAMVLCMQVYWLALLWRGR